MQGFAFGPREKTLEPQCPKNETPAPMGKKLHLRGQETKPNLFHIPLSREFNSQGLRESDELAGGANFPNGNILRWNGTGNAVFRLPQAVLSGTRVLSARGVRGSAPAARGRTEQPHRWRCFSKATFAWFIWLGGKKKENKSGFYFHFHFSVKR